MDNNVQSFAKRIIRGVKLVFMVGTCFQFLGYYYQQNEPEEIKKTIEQLIDNKDLMGANRLLNQNTQLDKEYIFNIINQTIEQAKTLHNIEALAYSYLSLGNFWFMQGNIVNAYDNYFQCETICRKNQLNELLATAIMNKSNLSKDFENRKTMLLEAITYLSKSNDSLNLAKAHLNLGNIYSSLVTSPSFLTFSPGYSDSITKEIVTEQEPFYKDSAFFHYRQAEEINNVISHHEISASLNLRYADWFLYEKNYEKAEEHLLKAQDYFLKASLIKGYVYSIIQLAEIKKTTNQFKSAIDILFQALEKSQKFHYDDYQADIYKLMVEIFEKKGDIHEALIYQKKYTQAMNHLNTLISQDKIHALNLEFRLKDQDYLIQSMYQKKKINNLVLFSISVLCLSIGIFAYLVISNRKRKIQTLSESIERNKQINYMEMELMQVQVENQKLKAELLEEKVASRSENLVQIANQYDKIESYYKHLSEEVKKISENFLSEGGTQKLKKLKLSLIKIAEEQKSLKELNALSSQINQDFIFHIEKNFSKITKDDKQLLSYLILGMNSKDISQLLNISTESVHKKRYRLRKKLHISAEQNFQDFYKEITKLYSQQ